MARPGACRPEASCVGPPWFEHRFALTTTSSIAEQKSLGGAPGKKANVIEFASQPLIRATRTNGSHGRIVCELRGDPSRGLLRYGQYE